MVLAMLAACALAQSPSPVELAGRHFYLASELERLEQHFDPSEWLDDNPRSIDFEPRSEVVLDFGQEGEGGPFSAVRKGPDGWEITIALREGTLGPGHWVWTGPHTAMTDLLTLQGEGSQMEKVVEHAPIDLATLQKRFDARYAASALPVVAGSYRDAKGISLVLQASGRATLGGSPLGAAFFRCDAEVPEGHAPCLVVGKVAPGARAFLFRKGARGMEVDEGRIDTDLAYYPFEAVTPAHVFARAAGESSVR